jgi:hypothetical protein
LPLLLFWGLKAEEADGGVYEGDMGKAYSVESLGLLVYIQRRGRMGWRKDTDVVTWFGGCSLEVGQGLFGCFCCHCQFVGEVSNGGAMGGYEEVANG